MSQLHDPVTKPKAMQAPKHEIGPAVGIPVLPNLPPPPNAPVLTLRQALQALFRGKWFVLVLSLGGLLLGTWLGLAKPNEYESVAAFRFRPGAEDIRVDPASTPEQGAGRYALRDNAQAILLSEELLYRVVERVGADEILAPYTPEVLPSTPPGLGRTIREKIYAFQRWLHAGSDTAASRSDALLALRARLRVEAPENSDLLYVRLQGNDAERAQSLLDAYMHEAQKRHQEVYDAASIIDLIEQNHGEAKDRHDHARSQLRSFLDQNGIRDFAADFAQSQQDLREVNRDVERLENKIDSDVLVLAALKKQLDETPRQIEVREQVPVENPRIEQLRTRIAGYEADLDVLRGQVHESDSAVQRLRDTIERLRGELEQEQKQPVRHRLQTRYEENAAWADLRTRIVTLETEQQIDARNLPEMRERQRRISARNDELSQLSVRYYELQDELAARSEDLRSARARLGIADTKRALDRKQVSSLQILNPASLPLEKIGPQRARIVVGGLFGALFASLAFLILRALTDRKIHDVVDLEKKLGLKVLATIPRLDRSNVRRHHRQRVTSWH